MPIQIANDAGFQMQLKTAGSKLVVVDFFATWCGPCNRVAPQYEALDARYPSVVFLKVDVDQCSQTARAQGVSSMPTFGFYRNCKKVHQIRGADMAAVEAKIREFVAGDDASTSGEGSKTIQGHIDLATLINKSACECLNHADDHPFKNCWTSGSGDYLESDCDEQLIMSFGFVAAVKLHSLKISAPEENGPKTLKLFINLPNLLDFDDAEASEPVQMLELKPEDLNGENLIPLRFVKFQNVQTLQIFVKDNQSGAETTRIDHFSIIGSPINMVNMGDFKRVTGKKGESH